MSPILLMVALMVSGCVEHRVTAPQLDPILHAVKQCPKVELPPIPNKMRLIINGDHVNADDAGLELLRSYVGARSALRDAK